MDQFKPLLETLFIPDWNTTAHVCQDGTIYISFIQGIFITKEQLRDAIPNFNEEFYRKREHLFDEVQSYIKSKYN